MQDATCSFLFQHDSKTSHFTKNTKAQIHQTTLGTTQETHQQQGACINTTSKS